MTSFNIPTNLNGAELRQELNAAGVPISDSLTAVRIYEGALVLEIAESDIEAAEAVIAAHNGTI
jgi:hypothetical protein